MARNAKKAQQRILNEIKTQLVLQAERWGRKDFYTPLKFEEMELDQCKKILGDLLSEKANIEYELHLLGTSKKEVLIKRERLEVYLKKAARVIAKHEKDIKRMIGKCLGDRNSVNNALKKYAYSPKISVMVGD